MELSFNELKPELRSKDEVNYAATTGTLGRSSTISVGRTDDVMSEMALKLMKRRIKADGPAAPVSCCLRFFSLVD